MSVSLNNLLMESCAHCGGYHSGQCPRVKAVEYYRDGRIKRVEYHVLIDTVTSTTNIDYQWTFPPFLPDEIICEETGYGGQR